MTRRSTFAPLAVLSLLALATPAAGQLTVQEVYAKASSPGLFDMLGGAVAVSGDTLVVGARQEDSAATGVDGNATDDSLVNVGAAYVFRRTAGGWVQEAYLKPASGDGHDNFGHAVAIDGDTIAVGAPGEDGGAAGVPSDNSVSNAGAVYVFRRDGSTWSPEAYVKPTVTGAHDNFGFSVALSGETLAVGAYQEGGSSTGVGGDPLDEGVRRPPDLLLFPAGELAGFARLVAVIDDLAAVNECTESDNEAALDLGAVCQ